MERMEPIPKQVLPKSSTNQALKEKKEKSLDNSVEETEVLKKLGEFEGFRKD